MRLEHMAVAAFRQGPAASDDGGRRGRAAIDDSAEGCRRLAVCAQHTVRPQPSFESSPVAPSALAAVLFLSRLSMHGCHVVGRGGGNHAAAPWPASTSVFDQYGHGVDQPPGTAPLASVFVGLTDCLVPSWLRLRSDLTDGALYACAGLPLSSGDGRPSTSEGVRTLGAVS